MHPSDVRAQTRVNVEVWLTYRFTANEHRSSRCPPMSSQIQTLLTCAQWESTVRLNPRDPRSRPLASYESSPEAKKVRRLPQGKPSRGNQKDINQIGEVLKESHKEFKCASKTFKGKKQKSCPPERGHTHLNKKNISTRGHIFPDMCKGAPSQSRRAKPKSTKQGAP